MRISGVRCATAGLLVVVAGLLAACGAAHPRPGARPAGARPPAHARATAGARLPHGSRPSVLAPGTAGRDGRQTYRADRPGQAVLVSDARGCLILRHPEARRVTTRTCPVATVTVVP
jgi:hypothetical protein